MNVSHDCDGRLDVHDVALAHQELLCLFADLLDERLGQQPFLQQRLDRPVEVEHLAGEPVHASELARVCEMLPLLLLPPSISCTGV